MDAGLQIRPPVSLHGRVGRSGGRRRGPGDAPCRSVWGGKIGRAPALLPPEAIRGGRTRYRPAELVVFLFFIFVVGYSA